MVKNAGGNKSKRGARKHSFTPQNKKTRFIEEEGEIYAAVIRILGGSNCEVMCLDGNLRLCVIRNKFKGRGKRDNLIAPGKWVLVGIRDWEVRANGIQKCDLLEVYTDENKDTLKKSTSVNFSALLSVKGPGEEECDDGEHVEFVDPKTEEYTKESLITSMPSENKTFIDGEYNEIDFDDI